jgi:GNAT superfamily N-acetyltransferase
MREPDDTGMKGPAAKYTAAIATGRSASRPPLGDALEIRVARPDDEPAVVALMQAAFGGWPRGVEGHSPGELFRRKHMGSPFGRSIVLVGETEGEIVGCEAWMPWRLRADGRTVQAIRGTDLAVHPDHRGRGVQKALVRAADPHFPPETAFIFANPNAESRPHSLSVGRREIGTLHFFVRVRRPGRAALALLSRKLLSPQPQAHPPVEGEPIAEALRDGEAVARLLSQADETSDRLATVKDVEYLRWKYGLLDTYRAIREERGGRLAGLAIVRARRSGPLAGSTVYELFVARGDRRLARHLLRKAVKAAPVDYVTCHFPSRTTPRDAAVRCGFVPARTGPVPAVKMVRDGVSPDPHDLSSWALCLGDFEMV